ncbi:MAG: Gfo/Idh/MocA family oxidoreductase [Propionibacteriales bacterium]|nr:Gfo/Idh/MocA family oxidoreductase [Propionibacteriales bacterium]
MNGGRWSTEGHRREQEFVVKIGIVGCGQFSGVFADLWHIHPEVDQVWVTDVIADRADKLVERYRFAGTYNSVEEMLASDVDAVCLFTQRWTHGPLTVQALEAGKHVYAAVPMAVSADEIAAIIEAVQRTGLIYMMGETSYYNPAVIWGRREAAKGAFGRLFYAEGDYVHDMDNGFYSAYQYSGGDDWKATASYPPMLYPTHAVGGVLGAWPTHAVSASCTGVVDDRGDRVFDREVSMFDNDFSNMSALFELADGGVMRTNEFRRVGHPNQGAHESRFRYYGTNGVMEQGTLGATFTTRDTIADISDQFVTGSGQSDEDAEDALADVDPALRDSFVSGCAPVHDRTRLPSSYAGAHNGHEGAHHFLADDFVRAIKHRQHPPLNAWIAARMNLPGIVAFDSARRNGERLPIVDHGDCPTPVVDTEQPW